MNKVSRAAHSHTRKQSASDNSQRAQKKTKTASKSDGKPKSKAGPQSAAQTKALVHAQENNAAAKKAEDAKIEEANSKFYQATKEQFEELGVEDVPMLGNYFVSLLGGPYPFQREPFMK